MEYATLFSYMAAFALLNRARGTRIFNLTSSTVAGRMVAMMGMAILTVIRHTPEPEDVALALVIYFLLLMLWASPAWDEYWAAEIGTPPHSKKWGVAMMTLRMSLILPFYAFIALQDGWDNGWMSMSWVLLSLTYLVSGFMYKHTNNTVIAAPELVNGAIIGATVWLMGT